MAPAPGYWWDPHCRAQGAPSVSAPAHCRGTWNGGTASCGCSPVKGGCHYTVKTSLWWPQGPLACVVCWTPHGYGSRASHPCPSDGQGGQCPGQGCRILQDGRGTSKLLSWWRRAAISVWGRLPGLQAVTPARVSAAFV